MFSKAKRKRRYHRGGSQRSSWGGNGETLGPFTFRSEGEAGSTELVHRGGTLFSGRGHLRSARKGPQVCETQITKEEGLVGWGWGLYTRRRFRE